MAEAAAAALLIGFWLVFTIATLVLVVVAAVWVYRDAKKRYPPGDNTPVIWLLAVLLTGVVGLILYLLLRPKEVEGEGRGA